MCFQAWETASLNHDVAFRVDKFPCFLTRKLGVDLRLIEMEREPHMGPERLTNFIRKEHDTAYYKKRAGFQELRRLYNRGAILPCCRKPLPDLPSGCKMVSRDSFPDHSEYVHVPDHWTIHKACLNYFFLYSRETLMREFVTVDSEYQKMDHCQGLCRHLLHGEGAYRMFNTGNEFSQYTGCVCVNTQSMAATVPMAFFLTRGGVDNSVLGRSSEDLKWPS